MPKNYTRNKTEYSFNIFRPLLIPLLSIFTVSIFAQDGLIAEYYDGRDFDRKVATQIENQIDRSWNNIPPVPGINPHICSIRWTGVLTPDKTGYYTFSARVDDGIRVWIDDQIVIDDWKLNDVGIFQGIIHLEGRKSYNLKVEYFNALIEGEIRLLWKFAKKKPSWFQRMVYSESPTTIPAANLSHTPEQARKLIKPQIATVQNTVVNKPIIRTASTSKEVPINAETEKRNTASTEVIKNTPSPKVEATIAKEIVTTEVIEDYIPRKIHFERTKSQLLEFSFGELDRLGGFLDRHPELTLKIEGHTDSAGDPEKNFILSQRRAYAVARYLVQKGISAKRIKAEGFGAEHPLIVTNDKQYHPENRRVEFIIEGGNLK